MTLEADVLISANWAYASTYAAHLAARLRGLPVVGLPLFHIACPWAAHPRYRALLAQAASVVTATQAEADFVATRGARRVDIVGLGVDPSRFVAPQPEALRERLGIGTRPVVGFVGRQDTGKGAPTLLDAMRLVWQQMPEAILLMAGPSAHRDKPTRQAIEGLLPEERDRLRLVDDFPDSEAASIFAACDLLALPSVEESFGLVFLEAWLCRRPVIGARIPSTECVIAAGRDGLIVNPMDPASLAEAVLHLLRHPERRTAMGEEGRRKVLANYTLDRMTDRWEVLLGSVARGRKAVAPGYADPLAVPGT
jgi:glycosyltransferase involved in cell wall biosynthesis